MDPFPGPLAAEPVVPTEIRNGSVPVPLTPPGSGTDLVD